MSVALRARWPRTLRLARDVTLAGTSGAAADRICQGVESAGSASDSRRTAAFAIFTGVYVGGVCSGLYGLYPRIAARVLKARATPRLEGAVCSALDNFLHVPLMYIPTFYLSIGMMRGESWENSTKMFRDSWGETVVTCWAFWIPAQFIIFSKVPAALRVPAVAAGDFAWNMVLSFVANRSSLSVSADLPAVPGLPALPAVPGIAEAGEFLHDAVVFSACA
mmetsp:Transcript_96451/g.245117  ORF Transcript_96451/g.245117 Transcript_96451/m.245117 type:complete len:221 (-) Transcript_96451:303-965(-)